jgi:hypothetical protein
MGTCLFAKALPSNRRVYLLVKKLFPSRECYFVVCFEVATQQRLYTLQYYIKIVVLVCSVNEQIKTS